MVWRQSAVVVVGGEARGQIGAGMAGGTEAMPSNPGYRFHPVAIEDEEHYEELSANE